MKKVFYVTCFNDPASCRHLLEQMAGRWEGWDKCLSNQSDEEHAAAYEALADEFGYRHLRWPNEGATRAKRRVVEHAEADGYDVMAQISEDFELVPDGEQHPGVVAGGEYFLEESLKLLAGLPKVAFVHWTYFRVPPHEGYFWSHKRGPVMQYRRRAGHVLSYLEGEVSLFNWPYTGRVKAVAEIWRRALKLVPQTEQQWKDHRASGGEWALTQASLGAGVCLVAHPVRHVERVKPEGSLP